MLRTAWFLGLLAVSDGLWGAEEPSAPGEVKEATEIYRTADGRSYRIHLYLPVRGSTELRAGIVLFHGWSKALGPEQFLPHCRHLAVRGMVAASADYRILKDEGDDYRERTLENARAAVRWMRTKAETLRLDPNRLAAGGGSGGGWAAMAAAMLPEAAGPADATAASARPDALVLFNPAISLGRSPELSPAGHIRAGLPPMIIFHGTEDELIPITAVERFGAEMQAAGNVCALHKFQGKKHSFFNYGLDQNRPYLETLRLADDFLAGLGFLEVPR